ncbi:MAG: Flp pilus assembly complex ATPase component TadA, partial [Planctomycetales bacterium]|nr:Flp pilus assembly complex ATPase component TadA [Planctomycetales bacterium]
MTAQLAASPPQQPPRAHKRLGELLVSSGVITEAELEAALRQQTTGQRIGETLVKMGFVEEAELLPFLAQQHRCAYVQLREGVIDPKAARLVPRALAEAACCLALFNVRGELTVAMPDPQDLGVIDRVERHTGLRVRAVLGLPSAIMDMIERVYGEGFQVEAVTADMEEGAISVSEERVELDLESFSDSAESPVINLVNYVILQAVRQHASDIHIEPGPRNTIVRFRVDGILREVLRPRREFHPALVSRLKVMAKMDIAEHRLPQDGRIHVVVDRREIDVRASTIPTVLGEKVVLRVLDRSSVTFRLDDLGIRSEELVHINQMLRRPHGLVLVTGPTGSGKTTTLYAALNELNRPDRKIITAEDPVEYYLPGINQVEVKHNIGLDFARIIRAMLRQAPNIILVGEMRDLETAGMGIQASLTGHLVFST